jgi:hypothetical protein
MELAMFLSKFLRASLLALYIGIFAFTGGCSADPDADEARSAQSAGKTPTNAKLFPDSNPARGAGATTEQALDPRLAVEGEGLRWFLQPSGSARPVPFGGPEMEVLGSLEKIRGPAKIGVNQDCGAGAVRIATWPDGLSVIFQDNRFAGWGLSRRAGSDVATAAGIRPGSTRAELEATYDVTVSQSSLGSEFSAGALHGVLDGASAEARVTDMWAGVNCVAR